MESYPRRKQFGTPKYAEMQENKQIPIIMMLEFFSSCQEKLVKITCVQFCPNL